MHQPHRCLPAIVPGRKGERVGEVPGGVWVRWQEVEGGPVGWLPFPPGRQGNQRPPHLAGHPGRGGWGGDLQGRCPGEVDHQEFKEEPSEQLADVVVLLRQRTGRRRAG